MIGCIGQSFDQPVQFAVRCFRIRKQQIIGRGLERLTNTHERFNGHAHSAAFYLGNHLSMKQVILIGSLRFR